MRDIVKVVEDFVASVIEGDIEAAMAMLADDVVIHHSTRLPYRGVYRGRAEFGELVGKIGGYWESLEPTPGLQVIGDGEGAAVITSICAKPRHRDETIVINVLERYDVKDGHIAAIWAFYIDTHLTAEQVSP